MYITNGNFSDPQTIELLRLHLSGMRTSSPPGHSYALDLTGLQQPSVSFWTAWQDDHITGCAALKELSTTHGEVKSMRTHPDHLRKGVAAQLLAHIIEEARARKYKVLSLETGSGDDFAPALRLYEAFGFEYGGDFADYKKDEFNNLMHLEL